MAVLFSLGIHIIKLLIAQFSSSLFYLYPSRHQYISENSLPEELQPLLFLNYERERPCSIAMQNKSWSRLFASLCFEIANLRTKSTHKTNLTCTGTYTLQMYKISSYISIVKPTRCTNVSNLFYYVMTHYMFRTVFPSIIFSSRLYTQQPKRWFCLLASKQTTVSVWQMFIVLRTVLDWWWTERPSETCRVSFQNKINLIHWCIWLVLL